MLSATRARPDGFKKNDAWGAMMIGYHDETNISKQAARAKL
jgi:hypothetical protein